MSFIGRAREIVGGLALKSVQTSNVSNPANWLMSAIGGGPTFSGISVGTDNSLSISAAKACVRNLSEDVAKLKLGIYKVSAKNEIKPHRRHKLYRLLHAPNDYQDSFQFFEQLTLSLVLTGNAYVVLVRNFRGDVVSMVPVKTTRVTIVEASDGELFFQVQRNGRFEERMLRGMPHAIPERDIMHVKLMSLDGIVGVSPVAQARETLGLAMASEKYQAKLLANGAKPGGVLEHPKTLSTPAYDRLQAFWRNKHEGLDNAGSNPILEEGMTWKQLGMTSVDAEFMASRRFTVEEICRIWRMPPHMIGDLSRSTNNNIAHQGTEYLTNTLTPLLERIERAFDKAFELADDEEIWFDTEGLIRGDALTQARTDEIHRRAGNITANEVRRKLRLSPKAGGDVLERPMNKAPAGEVGQEQEAEAPEGAEEKPDA